MLNFVIHFTMAITWSLVKWRPLWPQTPTLWYAGNASGYENHRQMQIDGRYSVVIFGWQTAFNVSAVSLVVDVNQQCLLLKQNGFKGLCIAYHSVASSESWLNSDAESMRNMSRRSWFLQDSHGNPIERHFSPKITHTSADKPRGWYWDHRNRQVHEYLLDTAVKPVLEYGAIDGIFFDQVDYVVCGGSEWEPCDKGPWNKQCGIPFPNGDAGKTEYFDGVWTAMREAARTLNKWNKLAVFSSTNYLEGVGFRPEHPNFNEPDKCIHTQDRSNNILKGLKWGRFYKNFMNATAANRGDTVLKFNRSLCVWQVENLLLESKDGIAPLTHTSVGPRWLDNPYETPALLNIETALAAFLIAAPASTPSFYGFSFGRLWTDDSYRRGAWLNHDIGRPIEHARRLGCCDGILMPHWYVHDAEGHHDLFNTPLNTAQDCSTLCCGLVQCAGFQWTSFQASKAGNCSYGHPCCWIKPTIGRIEHWSFNATPGSPEFNMVSGVKKGVTWVRTFENATVNLNCASPEGRIVYGS